MEVNQSEFGVIDAFFEELPVCFFPDAFLYRSVFDEFHISDQGHRVPTEKIANAGLGIGFKMGCLAVQGGAF